MLASYIYICVAIAVLLKIYICNAELSYYAYTAIAKTLEGIP
jgi:hypothetical protein